MAIHSPYKTNKTVDLIVVHLDTICLMLCVLFQIGQCAALGVLSLRDNRVMFIPREIGNLKELHVLDVSGNRYGTANSFSNTFHFLWNFFSLY
jgi:protein scribble